MPSPELPPWVPRELYPFESRFIEVGGARLHYVDEGNGPPLLLLHGNPTWSFLYREIIRGLRDRFRCIAPDYPGFGLSVPPVGYGFTAAEHAAVIERFVSELDLTGVTMMVQDWGGPIGFATATRNPERFAAFVIGNTWAWPKSDPGTQVFSRLLGGPIGGYLILQRNFFVERIIPGGVRRRKLPEAVMAAYRGPFPGPASRMPMHVFPREILAARPLLASIEERLATVADQAGAARVADQGCRLPRARTAALGTRLRRPSDGHARGCRALHPGGLAGRDHRRGSLVA